MAMRVGLGPVFESEWRTITRRWQVYAGRAAFVGLLMLALASVWAARVAGRDVATIRAMAEVGRSFFTAMVFTELTLVLLAAPAATAGMICQEKARGNLGLLLITDLSDAEIVLGKLAARLVPVLELVFATLPVLALGTLLGGIDPVALMGFFLAALGVAVLGCAITITYSVWGTKPYEVLLATFGTFGIWLLSVPIWEFFGWLRKIPRPPVWVRASNPFDVALAPYTQPGELGLGHAIGFFIAAIVVSALLVALVIARLRSVVVAQADRPARRRTARPELLRLGRLRIGAPPDLGANPLHWYEWHRRRPSAWISAMIRVYMLIAIGFSLLAIDDSLRPGAPFLGWFSAYVVAFEVTIGLPLILVAATTTLVEERTRGSLDVLLTTPLSSRGIVLAKWWGVFRNLPLMLALPATVAGVLAWVTGSWATFAVLLMHVVAATAGWTSIGLALSVWIPRPGRAMTAAVVLFTTVSLGWPILARTILGGPRPLGPGLAVVSPFYGVFDLTYGMDDTRWFEHLLLWAALWIAAYLVVAVALLLAVLATFDRSLGRIPDRPRPPRLPVIGPPGPRSRSAGCPGRSRARPGGC